MARTIIEIALKCDIDSTLDVIEKILLKYKYQNKIVKGENVWTKGDGVITVMQCFSYTFTENGLILQGWTRDALLGESALEGFMGMAIKKKMKSIMKEIEHSIS